MVLEPNRVLSLFINNFIAFTALAIDSKLKNKAKIKF